MDARDVVGLFPSGILERVIGFLGMLSAGSRLVLGGAVPWYQGIGNFLAQMLGTLARSQIQRF